MRNVNGRRLSRLDSIWLREELRGLVELQTKTVTRSKDGKRWPIHKTILVPLNIDRGADVVIGGRTFPFVSTLDWAILAAEAHSVERAQWELLPKWHVEDYIPSWKRHGRWFMGCAAPDPKPVDRRTDEIIRKERQRSYWPAFGPKATTYRPLLHEAPVLAQQIIYRGKKMSRDDRFLVPCTVCGCKGTGGCGRLIDCRDGSVWPSRDTGERTREEQTPEFSAEALLHEDPALAQQSIGVGAR